MNLYLHNIGDIYGNIPVTLGDALLMDSGERYDYVLTIIWIESQYVFYVLIDYLASDRLIVKNHEYI